MWSVWYVLTRGETSCNGLVPLAHNRDGRRIDLGSPAQAAAESSEAVMGSSGVGNATTRGTNWYTLCLLVLGVSVWL